MPGSLYTVTAISAVAEFIGFSLSYICVVAGRKWPHVISMVIGGLACVISAVVFRFYNGKLISSEVWSVRE